MRAWHEKDCVRETLREVWFRNQKVNLLYCTAHFPKCMNLRCYLVFVGSRKDAFWAQRDLFKRDDLDVWHLGITTTR